MSPRRRWLRLLTLLVGAGCLLAGPVSNQFFGLPAGPVFRYWRMYGGFGAGICDVQFFQQGNGGSAPLDRIALLGYSRWSDAPYGVQRIADKPGIDATAKSLCARLPRAAVVHAVARCGHPHGWKPVYDGSEPLCRGRR